MNFKYRITVTSLCLLAFTILPVQAAGKLIRPGRSIGSVTLGSSRAAIQKLLGKPSESKTYKGGLVEDRWNSHLKNPAGFHHYLTVMFKVSKSVQIKVTSPEYETSQHYTTATALSVWKQTYKHMRNVWYGYDVQPIPYLTTYYDSIQTGISFERSARNDWDDSEPADAIIVHRVGQKVIAEPGWTTVNSDN